MRKFFFIFLFFLLINELQSQNVDLQLLKRMNEKDMPVWDATMRGVSFSAYITMPLSIAGTWAHGYFTNDKTLLRNGYKSAIAVGGALAIATALKYTVNRTRPYTKYPNDITRRDFNNGPYSFPSGHTTSAFATATALSLCYKKWYVTTPAFLYAGLVGYSRMRLGVHYASDVAGGIVIGIGTGLLTWFIDKKLNK